MTRYFLGVVVPEDVDERSYATGAVAILRRGPHARFDEIHVHDWWVQTYFGNGSISAEDLRARIASPIGPRGQVEPLLRMVGIVDIAGTWIERAKLTGTDTAVVLMTNHDWVRHLERAIDAEPGAHLVVVFARHLEQPTTEEGGTADARIATEDR